MYTQILQNYYKRNPPQYPYHKATIKRTGEHTDICPECGTQPIQLDPDKNEEYCPTCGLITRASIPYVGNKKITYPYGLLI